MGDMLQPSQVTLTWTSPAPVAVAAVVAAQARTAPAAVPGGAPMNVATPEESARASKEALSSSSVVTLQTSCSLST